LADVVSGLGIKSMVSHLSRRKRLPGVPHPYLAPPAISMGTFP